ncbi:hypothetical protein [Geobacillus kaustophilus]|uniref:hypothetical protein n=1 Tax=Geobacillus kaustophilus TaxID=1462 RepID=UPI001E32C54E|nr:hypothetical protein [Geobacillus kaustophilus]
MTVPVFRDTDHLYRVIGEFMMIPARERTWEELRSWWGSHPSYQEHGDELAQINRIGTDISRSRIAVVFAITHPEAIISIDAKQEKETEKYTVLLGKEITHPDVRIETSGDVAHQFWGGNIQLPFALLTGKMKAKGSKMKALQLVPRIVPAFPLYWRYLELIGEKDLLRALRR